MEPAILATLLSGVTGIPELNGPVANVFRQALRAHTPSSDAELEQIDETLRIFGEAAITFSDLSRASRGCIRRPKSLTSSRPSPRSIRAKADARFAPNSRASKTASPSERTPLIVCRLCRHDRTGLDGAGGLWSLASL